MNKEYQINSKGEKMYYSKEYIAFHNKRNDWKRVISRQNFNKGKAGKLARQRCENKRRGLGHFPLNEWFEGSEGHHISQNFVIYMPSELHRSLSHCLETGKNMEQMNKLAIECLQRLRTGGTNIDFITYKKSSLKMYPTSSLKMYYQQSKNVPT